MVVREQKNYKDDKRVYLSTMLKKKKKKNVIFAYEKKPESPTRKFRPNNKKIKNLITSVKNETR